MPMLRLVLSQHERRALDVLAQREYRDATRQAALIVRRELERRGLLAADDGKEATANEVSNEQ
jgi:hypothetical protein